MIPLFQQGVDKATSQFEPDPMMGMSMPEITLDAGAGQGPFSEANTNTDTGFLSLLQGLKSENDNAIAEKNNKLEGLKNRFITLARQMSLEEFNQPNKGQISQQEALSGAVVALLAKMVGARDQYVMGGLQDYLGARNAQINEQYNQDLRTAQMDYQNRLGQIKTESDIADFQMKGLQGEIGGLQDYGNKLLGEMGDASMQEQLNKRKAADLEYRYYKSEGDWDNRLAVAGLSNEGRKALELLKIANPTETNNLKAQVAFIEERFGKAEADRFLLDYARTQGVKNASIEAGTKTENATRDLKVKELESKIKLNTANVLKTNAQKAKYESDTRKIIESFSTDITTDEEFELLESLMTQVEGFDKELNKAKLARDDAKDILDSLDPGEDGYEEAREDYLKWENAISFIERHRKMTEEEMKKVKGNSGKSSGSGSIPPFNPGNASLKGAIGGR